MITRMPAHLRVAGVLGDDVRVAVSGHDARLVQDPALAELLLGGLHRGHVGLRAHQDADARRVDLDARELLLDLGLDDRLASVMRRCRGAAERPSNEITSAAAYAAARAAARSAPSAVTPRTRPPAVTIAPSRSAVPAWKTSAPAGRRPGRRSHRRSTSSRIAARGEHDADGGARVPVGLGAGEAAGLGRRQQQLEQVRAQARQHDLRLGIAEAHVELEHLRAVRAEHQPGVEDAVERRAAARELVDHRLVHAGDRSATSASASGHRRVAAHAAGVRAGVAVADPLVVARRGERDGALAVAQREQRELVAVEELLDHDRRGRRSAARRASPRAPRAPRPRPPRSRRPCPPPARRP